MRPPAVSLSGRGSSSKNCRPPIPLLPNDAPLLIALPASALWPPKVPWLGHCVPGLNPPGSLPAPSSWLDEIFEGSPIRTELRFAMTRAQILRARGLVVSLPLSLPSGSLVLETALNDLRKGSKFPGFVHTLGCSEGDSPFLCTNWTSDINTPSGTNLSYCCKDLRFVHHWSKCSARYGNWF